MQALFDTTRMYPESWISPSDIGAFYNGMTEALFANNGVTEALGNTAVFAGVAGLVALPAIWLTYKWMKRRQTAAF